MGKRGHASVSLTVAFRVHRKLGYRTLKISVQVPLHGSGILSGGDSVGQQ